MRAPIDIFLSIEQTANSRIATVDDRNRRNLHDYWVGCLILPVLLYAIVRLLERFPFILAHSRTI